MNELIALAILLAAIAVVVWRLPRVDLGHTDAFRTRRFLNWFPLGLTYAFLYFGRYNINEATSALGSLTDNSAFGRIFGVGAWVYGLSFVVNGPLTDRLGGRKTILISSGGVAVANALIGALVWAVVHRGFAPPGGLVSWLCVLYGLNMYFQSFGAVSIVKVNAQWFHVRERGVLGGVFGILISLGLYFGYDWSRIIIKEAPKEPYLVFFIPAAILVVMFGIALAVIRDTPSDAGFEDFDCGDASSGDDAPLGLQTVVAGMARNRVILTIVAIEFCTGFLRNGVMSWYPKFAKGVGAGDAFVGAHWGLLTCVAGILGGTFAGIISDRVFHSRRGPVATVLYTGLTLGAIAMTFTLGQWWVGWVLTFMALNYVGVHGMLSGTMSADFGGKKNAGVATGIIDGFVYLGTGLQSLVVGSILPNGDAAKDPANWIGWPLAMLPLAVLGLILCATLWNARPAPHASKREPAREPAPEPAPDEVEVGEAG